MSDSDGIDAVALEDERFRAILARDYGALDRLMHDDLVYVHSSGVSETKAELIASMRDGSRIYRAFELLARRVRQIGDTVITHGRLRVEVTEKGRDAEVRVLYTCVYSSAAELRLLCWHATRLPG
jgi:ketosteroid isomerase-like protein